MFNKIPFEVAKKLLEKPLICRDFGNWIASKKNSYIYEFECGLLDQDEMTCSLHVKFHYFYHPLTKVTSYTLSVFDKQLYGMERVYQLEVKKNKKKIKDIHSKPHEHFGDMRNAGDEGWSGWNFTDALEHFLKQTNIKIIGEIESPEEFKLK